MTNVVLEEVEALSAIYGDDFSECSSSSRWKYMILFYSDDGSHMAVLYFTTPRGYPDKAPDFDLETDHIDQDQQLILREELLSIFNENNGYVIMYQWVEHVRSFLMTHSSNNRPEPSKKKEQREKEVTLDIHSGEPVSDRKSKFQAHICSVNSVEEYSVFMSTLMKVRTIAEATHNISAYRIETRPGIFAEDRDDDGERGAADNILFLLRHADVRNIAVCVTRWYGGKHLGPDRFKHINERARSLLEKHRYLKSKKKQKS